ncbi:RNA polymerase sigma factor [Pseudomonas sp. OHS18]|uniref:RNA polymerase sigma factor n=1 Tax=Pseudomonas sp. OHS18 TaxID=3399679 RepID=UPI003A8A4E6D
MRPPRDSDAQDGQFQRHAGELLRFLTRQLKCSELAADLRQETWLRFQRRGADEVGNLRAFLYRIARNLIIDHQRQQRARPQEEDVSVEPRLRVARPRADRRRCAAARSAAGYP